MGRPAMPEEFKSKATYIKVPPNLSRFVRELALAESRNYSDAINECIRIAKRNYRFTNHKEDQAS